MPLRKGYLKAGPGVGAHLFFPGRCPLLSMSFTDRPNAHTEPVGACLKNDSLVVEVIHPHVTPGRALRSAKPLTLRTQRWLDQAGLHVSAHSRPLTCVFT